MLSSVLILFDFVTVERILVGEKTSERNERRSRLESKTKETVVVRRSLKASCFLMSDVK